jgi:fatty acid-binding protein DegV
MHADDQAGAQQLANDLESALKIGDIPIYPCSASITTHAGPRALGVGFFV